MKLSALLLCIFLITTSASAQNGWFVQPCVSAGLSQVMVTNSISNPDLHSIYSSGGGLGFGYRYKRLRFGDGLRYLTTGASVNLYFATTNPATGAIESVKTIRQTDVFHHLMVPITVSYELPIAHRLLLLPAAGIEVSYNINEKESVTGMQDRTISGSSFRYAYTTNSFFATASLHVEYAVTHRLSILAGPAAHVMLTNIYRVPDNAIYKSTQHNNAYLFDAGVTWFLHKKAKGAAVPN